MNNPSYHTQHPLRFRCSDRKGPAWTFATRVFLHLLIISMLLVPSAAFGGGTTSGQERGDALYRGLSWLIWIGAGHNYNHAGVYTGYNGGSGHTVVEAGGWAVANITREISLTDFIDGKDYYGAYTLDYGYPDYTEREALCDMAAAIDNANLWYYVTGALDYDGWSVNGEIEISDIDGIRCDGVVEYIYEKCGHRAWWNSRDGDITHYDITNEAYVDEHNNMPGWTVNTDFELSPFAQRGAAGNTNTSLDRASLVSGPTLSLSSSGVNPVYLTVTASDVSGVIDIAYRIGTGTWNYTPYTRAFTRSKTLPGISSPSWVYYKALDDAGNWSTELSYYVNPLQNQPPNTPYNEYPSDGATNVSRTANLDWNCTDPDGDTVYYTVYFEKGDSSPDNIIKNDTTGSYADLVTLDYNSHYYWKVKADDHKGGVTLSPVWDFYTQSASTRIIRLSGDLAFGSVTVGQTSQRTLTIYNDGNSTLAVSGISYPTGFSNNWSGTISAGGSRNVTVTFAPTAATSYGGTVTVNSDKTSGTNTISCSGTGRTTESTRIIRLSGDLAFGSVTVGQTSQRTLMIYNDGNSTLSLYMITCPIGFSSNCSGWTIGAGSSQNVTVTFAPTEAKSYGGTVMVSSNKTSGTDTISCSGTGTNDDKPTVTVTATDSTASEPGTDTGRYRISRTGSTASSLLVYFTMSGSATNGTDYYTISSPKTISAGSSYVDVTLTPKDDSIDEGDETAVLTISTNSAYDRGSPYSATVTIQDIDCTYSIDPTSEHFSSFGGTGSVSVTAPSECSWTATSNDGWITITSGSSGSGNGTVYYSVSSSTGSRTGTMTIAGLTFTVTQDGINIPPTANAGPDQTVEEGGTVTLDGSNSTDPDDGIASYLWTQTAGTPVTLSDPTAVKPTFTSPNVGSDGESLTFQLTVTDNGGLQDTDTCIVNVTWENNPPTADVGHDQTVDEGVIVTLDGSNSSDPDDSIASYLWEQTGGTSVALSDTTAIQPTFTAPDVGPDGESLTFQLTVTDSGGLQSTDTCIVNVTWQNIPPTANADPDQTVEEGVTVTLDGASSTDPDDGIASYLWEQIGGPPVTLSDTAAVGSTFVTPPVDPSGVTLTFQLTVMDNGGLQATDGVSITINDNGITGFPDDVVTMTCTTGKSIGVKVATGGNCVNIGTNDPATITDTTNRPENLIYGLVDIQLKVNTAGATATVTIYLSTPVPDGYGWYKYSAANGWIDYSANAVFNATRDQVTLTLVDGGIGDADGVANGLIVDPSGTGSAASSGGGGGGSGGGGGCFIATAAFGSSMEKHVAILKDFRDNYLFPNTMGRIIVNTYYKYSPAVAHFIEKHETLRGVVRMGLMPLVVISYSTIHFGPVTTLTVFAVLFILPVCLVAFYRRKSRSHRATN